MQGCKEPYLFIFYVEEPHLSGRGGLDYGISGEGVSEIFFERFTLWCKQ